MVGCDRSGIYRNKCVDPKRPRRKRTTTKKCECPFSLVIKQSNLDDGFGILPYHGFHNHELIKYSEGHRHLAKLTPEKKEYIEQQRKAQVPPKAIAAGVAETFGKQYEPNIRQIYYVTSASRREERQGLNHAQHMLTMADKYNYTSYYEQDPQTNQLTRVFMCHPDGLRLLRTYPHVWLIDSTYKTNQNQMPLVEIVGITPVGKSYLIAYAILNDEREGSYVWLLEKLKLLIREGVEPQAIVTDRELGLMRAIETVFPRCEHLLCVWHIDKCVEAKAKDKLKSGEKGAKFMRTRWVPLWRSRVEERYLARKSDLITTYKARHLVQYVCDTWLVHERKFARCYTNRVLHFGTTTTSRVESAHSILKEWLRSSRCSVDLVWERLHTSLGRQLVEIQSLLESSRSRHLHDKHRGLFSLLRGFVAHKAIKLMEHEFERGKKLQERLYELCGCAVVTTHGLPCACKLIDLYKRNEKVHVEDCHAFWRTLEISADLPVPYSDVDRFQAICSEAYASRPTIFREATLILERLIHPEYDTLLDPPVNENVRGRPRVPRRSTRRDPSYHEHINRIYPTPPPPPAPSTSSRTPIQPLNAQRQLHFSPTSSHDVDRSQFQTSSHDYNLSQIGTPSYGVEYQSLAQSHITNEGSQGNIQHELEGSNCTQLGVPTEMPDLDITLFPYKVMIPDFMKDYLCGWYNPMGDGHCGFRAVAHALLGDEDKWMLMRDILVDELKDPVYKSVYGDLEIDSKAVEDRVKYTSTSSSFCGRENWMDTCDLFGYATMTNWAICVIGYSYRNGKHQWDHSGTILPLRAVPGTECPTHIIWMMNTGDHWLLLKMKENTDIPPPMPPGVYNVETRS